MPVPEALAPSPKVHDAVTADHVSEIDAENATGSPVLAVVGRVAETDGALASRTADCTRVFVPSDRCHTAVTSPSASTAICWPDAGWPAALSMTGVAHAPPAGRVAACTRLWEPSVRCHTAVASPPGSTATCGEYACWPASLSVSAALQEPPAGRVAAVAR